MNYTVKKPTTKPKPPKPAQPIVSYLRVSRQKKGGSAFGLGLGAQREAVRRYCGSRKPLAEFVEVESGTKRGKRPKIHEVIALCRERNAMLVIAKLDRLARNVHFIVPIRRVPLAWTIVCPGG